jgi:hypothetical protein
MTGKSPQTSNHLIWFELNRPSQPDDVDLLSAQPHFGAKFRFGDTWPDWPGHQLLQRKLVTDGGSVGYGLPLAKLTGSVRLFLGIAEPVY